VKFSGLVFVLNGPGLSVEEIYGFDLNFTNFTERVSAYFDNFLGKLS
jgi:hypothetical protein